MQTETIMGAAFHRAGVNIAKARLFAQATQCLQEAKTFEAALAKFECRILADRDLFREVCREYLEDRRADMRGYDKGSEGQSALARAGQCRDSQASRQNGGDEGHSRAADKAMPDAPSSPSTERSAGQSSDADEATPVLPVAADQRNGAGHSRTAEKARFREPRPVSAAYIKAARAGAKAMAQTVLDSFKVRDGRAIGDVTFGELESLRLNSARDASLFRQIQRHCANAAPDAKVRDILKAADLERMVQRAAEVADAA